MSIVLPFLALLLAGAFVAYHRMRLVTWTLISVALLAACWFIPYVNQTATIVAAVQAARVAHGHGASTFRWYFPTADAYADRLRQHGFQVQLIECTPRPTALPTGVAGWLRVFAAPLLDDLPAEARATLREASAALPARPPDRRHGLTGAIRRPAAGRPAGRGPRHRARGGHRTAGRAAA